MLLLIPFLVGAVTNGNGVIDYVILLMNFNFVLTLNPFFKFDGYWMMTDLLGIANLRKKGLEWLKYLVDKLRGKDISIRPYILSLTRGAKCGLAVYTIVVNLFFGFYFFYVIPCFFISFCQTFPDRLYQLMMELSYRRMPSWGNLQQLILQLFLLFVFVYAVYKVVSPFVRKTRWARS